MLSFVLFTSKSLSNVPLGKNTHYPRYLLLDVESADYIFQASLNILLQLLFLIKLGISYALQKMTTSYFNERLIYFISLSTLLVPLSFSLLQIHPVLWLPSIQPGKNIPSYCNIASDLREDCQRFHAVAHTSVEYSAIKLLFFTLIALPDSRISATTIAQRVSFLRRILSHIVTFRNDKIVQQVPALNSNYSYI